MIYNKMLETLKTRLINEGSELFQTDTEGVTCESHRSIASLPTSFTPIKNISQVTPSINRTTLITFKCVICKLTCVKQYRALISKNDEIKAYCKTCARDVAHKTFKSTIENKNTIKENKRKEYTASIDETKERYCTCCKVVHPIDYYYHFQTGELTDKCKIKRLKKSKTKGNAQRKYDSTSLNTLVMKDGGKIVKIHHGKNGTITTKTNVDFECGRCKAKDTKVVSRIERTGAYCNVCSNDNASKKKSLAATGVTKKLVNRNEQAYINKRKYTLQDVKDILEGYNTYILDHNNDSKIGTKQTIKFICANSDCYNTREKQLRDLFRGGCYCEECTQINKSNKISELRSRPPQAVNDPTKEKICNECHWKRDIEQYKHDQNNNIETSLCKICRDKKKVKDNKRKTMLMLKVIEDPVNQQKCTSCNIIRDKHTEFTGTNITCNMCRKHGNKGYLKLKKHLKEFNDTYKDVKKCKRCLYVYDVASFETCIQKKTGVLCKTCRDYMFDRNDEITNHYLKLKMDGDGCVDCGEDDIRLLEFDHIDRESKLKGMSECGSIEMLNIEYKKCELRCGICHRRRTKIQLNYGNNSRAGKVYVDMRKIEIGGCQICGWYDETLLEALEFDHVERDEKICCVSTMIINNIPFDMIDMEISKCQLLCIHCHKLKTIEDNGYYLYKNESRKVLREQITLQTK